MSGGRWWGAERKQFDFQNEGGLYIRDKDYLVGFGDVFVMVFSEGFLGKIACNKFHLKKIKSHYQMKSGKNRDKVQRVPVILSNMYESPVIRACRAEERLCQTVHWESEAVREWDQAQVLKVNEIWIPIYL